MLELVELDFDYQDKPLLSNISFHLPAGGLLHLKGANGVGKTTLLRLIAGLHQPAEGQIRFYGQAINDDLTAYQRQLCFVGHKTGINPYLTLRENCFFDLHYDAKTQDVNQLASVFHLTPYLDYPCGLLSAGQRRQAGLLRMWMSDKSLWLLDEPLVALDETALATVMAKIEEHRSQGGAVLLTSHQNLPFNKTDYMEYSL